MRFFRSERMTLCQMLLHKESAFDCLVELGYLGLVEFINSTDPNVQPNNQFVGEIQRAADMQRVIRYLEEQMMLYDMVPVYYPDVDEEEKPKSTDLKDIEQVVQQVHQELTDVDVNYEDLKREKNRIVEHKYVLTETVEFLHGDHNTQAVMAWSDSIIMSLIGGEDRKPKQDQLKRLGYVAGTIPSNKMATFERVLWRTCHNNFWLRYREIAEPLEDSQRFNVRVHKLVFVVFFVGDGVRGKVMKICQGFRCTLYPCPDTYAEFEDKLAELKEQDKDISLVLERTEQHRKRILLIAAADMFVHKIKIKKILMVYTLLNKLSVVRQLHSTNYLQADCWIPSHDVSKVRRALMRGARRSAKGDVLNIFPPILSRSIFKSKDHSPPTFFRLNKLTQGFQNLIDSYGVAAYRELNPAPYTIVTFPFLFGVMFGDVGHGLIITLFGLWMVKQEKQLERKLHLALKPNEIAGILFSARYIILLMGLFSTYTGFIYNEMFSKSLNIFGSHWTVDATKAEVHANPELSLDPQSPRQYEGSPYLFGVDPVWGDARNVIVMTNSYKMKMAIIIGVTQMMFGLSLGAVNNRRNTVDLFLVVMPQLIFLSCLFCYLCFLMVYKWCMYGGHYEPPYNSACAPSILITFIDMLLLKESQKLPNGCNAFMFRVQATLQYVLLLLALLTVPILLAGKPLHIMRETRRLKKMRDDEDKRQATRRTMNSARGSLYYNVEEEKDSKQDDINIGEVWIHQGIHCIESVLGSVSHTASYLRLWALSLAHDQLSEVLWNMVLRQGLARGWGYLNTILLVFVFAVWSVLTLAILVVMEGLSAFLHTLRLHWVEFQSKFYAGSGEAFMPFRFERSSPSSE